MKRRTSEHRNRRGDLSRELGALRHRIQYALLLITIVPIIIFSSFIIRYAPPQTIELFPVAVLLLATMALMLGGTRIILNLVGSVTPAGSDETPARPPAHADLPGAGGGSVRRTMVQAVALIGVIPLLAFGYVVVRYVLPIQTEENIPLIVVSLALVVALGMLQVYRITYRILSIAADARRVRTESGPPGRDTGHDEISGLSDDLGSIAEKLSLRVSEIRRTRAFVERLPLPMLVLDEAGAIVFSNRAAQELLGYGEEELAGREAGSLFADGAEPAWLRGEGGDAARETLWVHRSGAGLPVAVRIGPLDGGRCAGGSVLVAIDIAERKRVEDSLRASEERYRSIFDDSPISLWMEDFSAVRERIDELRRAGVEDFARYLDEHPEEVRGCASRVRIVDVNRATLAMYEVDRKEELMRDLAGLFSPETLVSFTGELLAVAAGRTRFEGDAVALTRKGTRRQTSLTWTVVPGYESTYGRVLVSIIDITERVRAFAELKRERDTLRKYMDVSKAIFLVLSPDARVQLINGTGCEILGYPEREIVGSDWVARFIPPQLREEMRGVFNKMVAGDMAMIAQHANPVLTRGGEERLIEWRNALLTGEGGSITGMLCSGHDVTEQKRMEEYLFQARKLESVGTLAGGIAHDFNNLLAGIVGYAYLARGSISAGSRAEADLDAIERLAMRGSALTKALLAFAHGGDYHPEPLDANRCVEEVLLAIRNTAGPTIECKKELAPALPLVLVDRSQFRQCLANLCINACEAMPGGGTLTVRTGCVSPDAAFLAAHPGIERGAFVAVAVSDTGVGMDAGTKGRIFDPFFSTKDDKTGNGLGLPMVHGVAERAGGVLDVESSHGKGSTFTLYIPVRAAGIAHEAPDRAPAAGGKTILLVDDETDFRNCAARWLARLGYRVIEASSGAAAVRILEKRKDEVGLVLLDMVMKGGGGAETFRELRSLRPDLRVLICSGYALDAACRELISNGALGFVQKPFEHAALAARIREILGPGTPGEAEGG